MWRPLFGRNLLEGMKRWAGARRHASCHGRYVFVVCLLTGSISVSLEEKSPIEVSREIVAVKVHGRSWRTGFRASREVGPRQTGKHRTGCNLLQE